MINYDALKHNIHAFYYSTKHNKLIIANLDEVGIMQDNCQCKRIDTYL